MLLRNLTKVWVSEYISINNHGEKSKVWKFKEMNTSDACAYLNLQQDINELDRNSSGDIDYSIENARTTVNYNIQKGNGISLTDISKVENFVPEYIVTDNPKIGSTILYKLEKYHGN